MSLAHNVVEPRFATHKQVWHEMQEALHHAHAVHHHGARKLTLELADRVRERSLRLLTQQPPQSFMELVGATLCVDNVDPSFYCDGHGGQVLHPPNEGLVLVDIPRPLKFPNHQPRHVLINVGAPLERMVDLCDFLYFSLRNKDRPIATVWENSSGYVWLATVEYERIGELFIGPVSGRLLDKRFALVTKP